MSRPPLRPRETRARALEREHAGCWPIGHLAGWRGASGYSSRTTAEEVVQGDTTETPTGGVVGKVAIVTGGNAGVGFETARALALGGAHAVILACRDTAAGETAVERIKQTLKNDLSPDENNFVEGVSATGERSTQLITCIHLDLESFTSVHTFVKTFNQLNLPLHLLIHNAGIMPAPFLVTEDGHERTMQVNFLSPFLLTRLLTPKLRERFTPGEPSSNDDKNVHSTLSHDSRSSSRVVFVSSAVHRFTYPEGVRGVGELDVTDVQSEKDFQNQKVLHDPVKSYAESKLCVILLARILGVGFQTSRDPSRHHEVHFHSVHPGAIVTKGSERARLESGGWRGAVLHAIGKPFLKSCQAGAATTVRCCSMSCTESRLKNGSYHVNCEVKKPSKLACSVQLGRKVVRHAIRVTNRACDDAIADDHFANVLLNGTYGYLN